MSKIKEQEVIIKVKVYYDDEILNKEDLKEKLEEDLQNCGWDCCSVEEIK